ncbi:MAG: AAA family ATPase [Granulosicoccaceae bacterium]
MLTTLSVSNYRSLQDLVMPLSSLSVITGDNGSGKSNLYRALRLLSDAANGDMVPALAQQGGLPSTLWAGPEKISRTMERGDVSIQGGPRSKSVRLKLGFASDEYGYLIELGLPEPLPYPSAFQLDPVIKRESIWQGPRWRLASALVERKGPLLKRRNNRSWEVVNSHMRDFDSLFSFAGDPTSVPEVFAVKTAIQNWRFYSDFRTDEDAPARQSKPATRTPVLSHDGSDLAAALQTIIEVGDHDALNDAIDDAFPGSILQIDAPKSAHLEVSLQQPGLLRSLQASEWSDGMLRYVLLVAALLSPRPPDLLVLNEPETSLHPDLLGPLGRLIRRASDQTQVWVISHAPRLVAQLEEHIECSTLNLAKSLGRTQIAGLRDLDRPAWQWPPS